MSSRDGSNRTGGRRRSPQPNQTPNPRANWDVDPAEIDRYLSGRPSRGEQSQGTARRPGSQQGAPEGTADQLDQLQRARRDQSAQPARQQNSRSLSAGRQQFVEPEYEDDAYYESPEDDVDQGYDDGFMEDETYTAAPARQSGRQQPSQRQSQPQRQSRPQRQAPRQPVYDDEYDEELYADDPYLTYNDDDDWKAPANRRPVRSRPQVKLNKPNLPKITVPHAISQAELVNDIPALSMIGGAILSAAIMAIVVSNRLDVLPDIIPTHVSASGLQENLQGRNAMWSIPLLVTGIALMNIAAAWFFARIDMFAARFMLAAALVVQFVAWIAVLKYLWP